ncbi:HAD family hydrolase [Mycoplasmopsis felis]|nr:HAD hydrolase family protein [Mycoplasmopsis felis]WAM00954.1 HAD family hydrolase [Mycoplasmopsis felis]
MLRRFYCPEYFINKTNHIKLDNNPSWKNDYINKIIVLYDDNQEAIVNVLDIQKTQSYVFLRIKEISFDLDSVDNFVFDLDGTLLNKKSMLSNEQLQSLNTLKSLNKKIIISTGRPWFTAENIIKDIPTNLPISFANGSIIKHNNEVIKYFNIHQETGINLYKKLVEWEYDFLVYTPDKIYGYNTNKTDFFINKKYPERIGNKNYAEGNFSLEINNWIFCKFLVIRRSNDKNKMKWIIKVYKKTISIIWSYIRRTLFRCYGV